jgi:signal transduction histidine kinase
MHNANELRSEQLELTGEVWAFVHNIPTALRSVTHFLETVIDNLSHPEVTINQRLEFDSSTAQAAFSPRITRLADALDRLISSTETRRVELGFSEEQINELRLNSDALRRMLNLSIAIAIPEAATNAAADIRRLLDTYRAQGCKFSAERVKEVKRAAESVQHLACLYHLHIVQEQVEKLRQNSLSLLEWRYFLEQPHEPPKVVGVNEVVKAAIRSNRLLARRRSVRLISRWGPNAGINVAEEETVAAVQQLIFNGIKYTDFLPDPPGTWIKIQTRVDKEHAFIEVESWGRPIAEDEIRLGKIWEPGYRGRSVRRSIPDGAGLGLSRVKRMVDKNSGSITVSSVPAKDDQDPFDYEGGSFLTTFTLSFPLAPVERHYNSGAPRHTKAS